MTVEYGYLGGIDLAAGRIPNVNARGDAIYTGSPEQAWANELLSVDGKFRFMKSGTAQGRGPGNALDAVFANDVTIIGLVRPRVEQVATFITKGNYGGNNWFGLYTMGSAPYGPIFQVKRGAAGGVYQTTPTRARKLMQWQWVAGQRSGAAINVWADGLKATTAESAASMLNTTDPVRISSSDYGVDVACVMVFNRALSDTEVANIMSGKSMPKSVDGLQAYYKFNEQAGTSCTDYSGKGNALVYSADYATLNEEFSPDGSLARAFVSAAGIWSQPANMTNSGGMVNINAVAASSTCNAAGIFPNASYKVTYTVSDTDTSGGGCGVRILLYGPLGWSAATTTKLGNGTFTEIVQVTPGGSAANKIGVQSTLATTKTNVSNLSVVPVSLADGLTGQPYVTRKKRDPTNWWENAPPRIASPNAQGSVLTTASNITAPDTAATRVGNSDMTIDGWIKCLRSPNNTVSTWSLLSKNSNTEYRFDVASDGKTLQFYRSSSVCTVTLARPIPLNTWVKATVVHVNNGSPTAYFYLNGVLVGSSFLAPGVTSGAGGVAIGALTSYRAAQVRSVRLFWRALSQAEIASLFMTDAIADRTALAGEWMCKDLAVTALADTSGNGTHSNTFSVGANYMVPDSPYAMLRQKRFGKQLTAKNGNSVLVPGLQTAVTGKTVLTMVGWIKSPGAMSQSFLRLRGPLSGNSPLNLYRNGSGKLQISGQRTVADATVYSNVSQVAYTDTDWHLYAVEVTAATGACKVYRDGVLALATSLALSAGAAFDASTETGGMQVMVPNAGSNVVHDDLRLYTRALTAAEHYNLFLGITPSTGAATLEYLFENDVASCVDTSGTLPAYPGTWQGGITTGNYVSQQ